MYSWNRARVSLIKIMLILFLFYFLSSLRVRVEVKNELWEKTREWGKPSRGENPRLIFILCSYIPKKYSFEWLRIYDFLHKRGGIILNGFRNTRYLIHHYHTIHTSRRRRSPTRRDGSPQCLRSWPIFKLRSFALYSLICL